MAKISTSTLFQVSWPKFVAIRVCRDSVLTLCTSRSQEEVWPRVRLGKPSLGKIVFISRRCHQLSLSLGSEGQMPPYAYSCLHSFCSGLSESWLWTYLHTFLLLSTWQLKSLLNTWKRYKNLPHGNGSHTSPAEILCSVPLW